MFPDSPTSGDEFVDPLELEKLLEIIDSPQGMKNPEEAVSPKTALQKRPVEYDPEDATPEVSIKSRRVKSVVIPVAQNTANTEAHRTNQATRQGNSKYHHRSQNSVHSRLGNSANSHDTNTCRAHFTFNPTTSSFHREEVNRFSETRAENLRDGMPPRGQGYLTLQQRKSIQQERERSVVPFVNPQYMGFMKYRLKVGLKIKSYLPEWGMYEVYSPLHESVYFAVPPEFLTYDLKGDEAGISFYTEKGQAVNANTQTEEFDCDCNRDEIYALETWNKFLQDENQRLYKNGEEQNVTKEMNVANTQTDEMQLEELEEVMDENDALRRTNKFLLHENGRLTRERDALQQELLTAKDQLNSRIRPSTTNLSAKAISAQKYIQTSMVTMDVRRTEIIRLMNGLEASAYPKICEILEDFAATLSSAEKRAHEIESIFNEEFGQVNYMLRTSYGPDGQHRTTANSHEFKIPQPYRR